MSGDSITHGFARGEVRRYGGVPTIFIDDQPIHGMTATSTAFSDPQVIRDFVSAGSELMMIWIEAGIECWRGIGEYDWSYAEAKLRHFEENSGDTRWIIRIRLGLLASWFRDAFPDEVHNPKVTGDDPGRISVCNITSSVWIEQIEDLLKAFVGWLKTTRWAPRIAGFMVNAGSTEEWLLFDTADTIAGRYHPVYTRELRSWLRKTYNDDLEALRTAWGNDTVTFDTARPPAGHLRKGSHIWGPYSLRDPATDRPATDFYLFLNETLADRLIACCRAVKEAAGSPVIVGGFHSYLWWETGVYSYIQEYGHGLIQCLNASPWVDFVSDITSYDDRYPGGPSGYLGLPHSLNLHGKLHYTEVDLSTTVNLAPKWRDAWAKVDPGSIRPMTAEPAIPDPVWRWDVGYCGRDEEEQVAVFQREHIHNLITGTPYWWFDIRGHNYQTPAFVEGIRQLSDIGKEAIHRDRSSLSQVAFVVSEDTPMRQASMSGETLRFELESCHGLLADLSARKWGLAGLPFDTYELHDLAAPDFPGDQYRLLVFINCAYVSEAAAAGVRRWQNGQRTLLWCYAPAVLDDNRLDPAIGDDLRGIRLGWRKQRQNIHLLMDDGPHPLVKGGAKLNFGTEGSAGPVFFADDPEAVVLGRLRDGGEAAFAVRDHGDWTSAYLSMLNFGPDLLRNFADYAGAHVWCSSDDVVYANRSMLCLHTASPGDKVIHLPGLARVTDLWSGEASATPVDRIEVKNMPAYRTRAWQTEYLAENESGA